MVAAGITKREVASTLNNNKLALRCFEWVAEELQGDARAFVQFIEGGGALCLL